MLIVQLTADILYLYVILSYFIILPWFVNPNIIKTKKISAYPSVIIIMISEFMHAGYFVVTLTKADLKKQKSGVFYSHYRYTLYRGNEYIMYVRT